jgi:hypothetical protein
MPELIAWPFPLPERFTEAFENPALRARVAELLRLHGLYYEAPPPPRPAHHSSPPGGAPCLMTP